MAVKSVYNSSTAYNSANPLSALLNKKAEDYTRADILRAVKYFGIEFLTFHYLGIDGRMRSLKLPFADLEDAERILAMGERADGSSLFQGLIDSAVSDIYIVPRYSSIFINPFNNKSLDFMCRFVDSRGSFAMFSPDGILAGTAKQFQESTGHELWAMGELEFFLVYPQPHPFDIYPAERQGGYHISEPFFKYEGVVNEIIHVVQQVTGAVKYAHSEVGNIRNIVSSNPVLNGMEAEQYELEFNTRPICEAADNICLARWLIRSTAAKYGLLATFTPKLAEDAAGSGMHIHVELRSKGRNVMLSSDGTLSEESLRLIGGLARYAPTLSAFGNTQASSFLRLVPNQEAPTKICWSYSNRSSLIRIPLGWNGVGDLSRMVNPQEPAEYVCDGCRQTIELRSPDGSANIHLLMAGMATAVKWGLEHDEAMDIAMKCQVKGNVFSDAKAAAKLESLPQSCSACADLLVKNRDMYEKDGHFPPYVIDYVVESLRREKDKDLRSLLNSMSGNAKIVKALEIMHRDLHRC